MAELIKTFFPWLVFLTNLLFLILLLAYFGRNTWGNKTISWFGRNSLPLSFAVALIAVIGSLSYSNIVGWEPCLLCIWQRIFIYPQAVILGVALVTKDKRVFKYSVVLAILAAIISIYHVNIQWGGLSVLPCSATGPSCNKVFSKEFGYITIPMMALSASLYIIGLALASRYSNRE